MSVGAGRGTYHRLGVVVKSSSESVSSIGSTGRKWFRTPPPLAFTKRRSRTLSSLTPSKRTRVGGGSSGPGRQKRNVTSSVRLVIAVTNSSAHCALRMPATYCSNVCGAMESST
eukprot:3920911-Rhodomonas_salina.3